MNECPHLQLRLGLVGKIEVWRCTECRALFTIKPFEIQATYPEGERQEGEQGR